jgi:hypothetical protein
MNTIPAAAATFLAGCSMLLGAASARADDPPPFVPWSSLLPGLTFEYEPSSSNICNAGRPSCVDSVIAEQQKSFDRLAATCDHNAIFGLSYLRTTQEFQRAIEDPGFFADPRFVTHEDALFNKLYFDAFDDFRNGRLADVPPAWAIAFQAAKDRAVSAAGDLVLGINAHVNRDLPFVLAAIGLVKPDGSSRKPDHDMVNVFLNRVMGPLIPEEARRFDPTIAATSLPGPVDEVLTFQIIPAWRELAWRNAERLVTAPDAAARARVAAGIEASAAAEATLIRTLTSYPLGVGRKQRDDYCAAQES